MILKVTTPTEKVAVARVFYQQLGFLVILRLVLILKCSCFSGCMQLHVVFFHVSY